MATVSALLRILSMLELARKAEFRQYIEGFGATTGATIRSISGYIFRLLPLDAQLSSTQFEPCFKEHFDGRQLRLGKRREHPYDVDQRILSVAAGSEIAAAE